jgi:hypothetical protein
MSFSHRRGRSVSIGWILPRTGHERPRAATSRTNGDAAVDEVLLTGRQGFGVWVWVWLHVHVPAPLLKALDGRSALASAALARARRVSVDMISSPLLPSPPLSSPLQSHRILAHSNNIYPVATSGALSALVVRRAAVCHHVRSAFQSRQPKVTSE